jgi:hypothetical protein
VLDIPPSGVYFAKVVFEECYRRKCFPVERQCASRDTGGIKVKVIGEIARQ